MATKTATTRDIVRTIAREYAEGRYQRTTKDLPYHEAVRELPWEIHYRTQCSWSRAMAYADDIRSGKIN